MNESTDKTNLESIRFIADSIEGMAQKKVDAIRESIYQEAETLKEATQYRIGSITLSLTPYISSFIFQTNYRIVRVTLHASPEIFALIMTFVTLFKIVTWIVRIFSVIRFLGTIWRINQIILSLWPSYKRWWDNMMVKVSELSQALGWGVDGIIHVYNAINLGVHLSGRLLGKSWDMLQVEGMEKSVEMAQKISRIFDKLQANPSAFLDDITKIEMYKSGDQVRSWLWTITNTLEIGLNKAEEAFEGVQGVIGELSAIQSGMPEVVREHIPQSIWDGLQKADDMIHDNIMPRFTQINNALSWINSLQTVTINVLGELAGKLALPGDVLLGVDDLPDYMKAYQERLIDDVSSREFELWTDIERADLGADINDFDRINTLLSAPTPQPQFLDMEVPPGKTIRGIPAEPHETWFVGDY